MELNNVKKALEEFNQSEVNIYLQYLHKLATEKEKDGSAKNKWIPYFQDAQAIHLYKTVAKDGLFIDGDTITLQFKGSVVIDYNYQAYKNKLLKIYPETKFDIQNVYFGDDFKFLKENGKVIYSHSINNPFEIKKKIIGCYCIIKNNRGDFIETLNMEDIQKMRNVAKTQAIWNAWESEMILKSVIKRACKRHFKDVISNIETIDAENYDLETVDLDFQIKELIDGAQTEEELGKIYNTYLKQCKNEKVFIQKLTERKTQLKS
jgi:hypothetical protein